MKRNLVNVSACVCAIMSISICSASFAGNTSGAQPGNNGQVTSNDESRQVLTNELKAKVAAILSKYNAAALTAADAKAINNAFREAGVRRGPAQKEAIIAAGFDPQKISSLDPPAEPKCMPGSKSKPEQQGK